ncbi:MAG: hypothetical protein ACREJ3_03880, partial [Polyangiaceae bacterium]
AALAAPSPEQMALDEAKALCATGSCDAAHARLLGGIAETSPLRSTQTFKDIEAKWADQTLAKAAAQADPSVQQAMDQKVAEDIGVDPARRKMAADKLQALEEIAHNLPATALPSAPAEVASARVKTHPEGAGIATRAEMTERVAPKAAVDTQEGAAPAPPATAAPASPPRSGGGGTDERERQLALQGTADSKALLKQLIEQRMASGRASETEIRLLVSTCKDLGDRACVQSARSALAKLQQ